MPTRLTALASLAACALLLASACPRPPPLSRPPPEGDELAARVHGLAHEAEELLLAQQELLW